MSDYLKLQDFLTPINKSVISNDNGFNAGQIGYSIDAYESHFPDIGAADIIFMGVAEQRGEGSITNIQGPDKVREELYSLFYWHPSVLLADIGNVKSGARLADTYAAVKTIAAELIQQNKTVFIIGGSHDITLAQYDAFVSLKKIIEVVNIDAVINLKNDSPVIAENFLMPMLTGEPNFIRHYSHIGFQSYYMHPAIMDTMNKLGFDCYRLGKVKEDIDEMEPIIRPCSMMTIDMCGMAQAFAPGVANPNGFNGEEICMLTRFAGMSPALKSIGIYGYRAEKDSDNLTAKQIAQMIWYFIDGKLIAQQEYVLENKEGFIQYHTALAEVDTIFLQSKKTGRWWMQMPDQTFIACSKNDYLMASSNEIPERWLRVQERG